MQGSAGGVWRYIERAVGASENLNKTILMKATSVKKGKYRGGKTMQGIETKLGIYLLISFFTIVPIVIIIVTGKKWIAKHKEKNAYIVRMPAWFTRLMIASAVFGYATALAAVFQEELEFVVLAVPFCFIYMADFGCFLAFFWVMAVNEEEGSYIFDLRFCQKKSIFRISRRWNI
ncbi:MAG: hypothetical protein K2K54_08385 [Lachnospiraceae bacterium]|nr:hypothetical protein [Lachnospiraceae bacterium]